MKLCTVIWGRKTKIEFVRGQNPIMHSPILPRIFTNFTAPNAFSMGRSKHCSIDARWPIIAVNTSHDSPQQPLGDGCNAKKCYNHYVTPKLPEISLVSNALTTECLVDSCALIIIILCIDCVRCEKNTVLKTSLRYIRVCKKNSDLIITNKIWF